jgi:hypothetical protein
MAKSVSDILPGEFKRPERRPPVEILRELAADLQRRTGHKIRAKVVSTTSGNSFVHSFVLEAPRLDYEGELFHLENSETFYPAMLYGSVVFSQDGAIGRRQVQSEDELIDALADIFRLEKTNDIISALLTQ